MHLPIQLAQVDPIVASFCGGAVGVLSTIMVLEANNATVQSKRRCFYCEVRGRARAVRNPMYGSRTWWCRDCGGVVWPDAWLGLPGWFESCWVLRPSS